jgi:hypothetical protein
MVTALSALSLVLVKSRGAALLLLAVLGILVAGFVFVAAFARARHPRDGNGPASSSRQRWLSGSWKATLRDSAATPPE